MPLDVAAVWAEVNRIATTSRRVRAVLGDLRLASFDATGVLLEGSALAVSAARAVQGELASVFQQACGRTISILLRAAESVEGADGGSGTGTAPRAAASAEDMRKHPLVTAAEELFGARLVRVDVRQGGQS